MSNNTKNSDIYSILVDDNDTKKESASIKVNSNIYHDNFMAFNINNIFGNEDLKKERVLCIGQVQSGKTATIINIIKKAIDLTYDAIVIIAGTNKILLNQSEKRIKQELNNNKYSLKERKYVFLSFNSYNSIGYHIQNNHKFIICILKADKSLTKITEQINTNISGSKKFLIIDDESDYGTINSQTIKNPSKFYDLLEQIYENISNIKLIYVTATPFAHILSEKIKKDYPKIISLKNHNDYCGVNSFGDNNYLCIQDDEDSIYAQIYYAIFIYLIYSAKSIIDIDNNKTQLLINVSQEINDHIDYKEFIESRVNKIYEMSDFELEKEIKSILDYFKLTDCLNDYLYQNQKNINDEIRNILRYLIDNKSCYELNGNTDDSHYILNKFSHQIIIGGVMLSRGVTFEHLICELIIMKSDEKNIDVLLQKCRWFGYRGNKAKYMKIIINKNLQKTLEAAKEYVNLFQPGPLDFWDTKEKIINLDKNPTNMVYKIKGTSYGKTK